MTDFLKFVEISVKKVNHDPDLTAGLKESQDKNISRHFPISGILVDLSVKPVNTVYVDRLNDFTTDRTCPVLSTVVFRYFDNHNLVSVIVHVTLEKWSGGFIFTQRRSIFHSL